VIFQLNSLPEQGFWIMDAGPAPLLAPLQIKALKLRVLMLQKRWLN